MTKLLRSFVLNRSLKVTPALLMMLLLQAFSGQAQSRSEISLPWDHLKGVSEVVSLRDANTKHFPLPNGGTRAYVASGIIHYKRNGVWEDIDNSIKINNTGRYLGYTYCNTSNTFETFFPANPFVNPIVSEREGVVLNELVKGLDFLDQSGSVIFSLPIDTSNVQYTVNDNQIEYYGFYPGLKLVYTINNSSRKFDLIIENISFLSVIPQSAIRIAINEDITSSNHEIGFNSDENGLNLSKGSEILVQYPNPVSFDENVNNEFGFETSQFTTSRISNGVTFKSLYNISWLKSSERVFPLHLDPVANFLPTFIAFWTGYQTSSTTKTSGYLRITGSTTASWAKYNISSIPVGSTINTVTYYGNHYTTTNTTPQYCRIRQMVADPVPAAAATLWSASTTGTIYNNSFLWSNTAYGWRTAPLTGGANTYLQSVLAQGWFAIGVQWASGGTTFAYHYGINGNTTNCTYLTIDYGVPACTGTPNAGTAAISSTTGCPSVNFNLSATGITSAGGISYQWQSGPTAAGPWTAVPGGTTVPFTTSAASTTFYRLVTTCSNSGLTNTSSVVSYTVAGGACACGPYPAFFATSTADEEITNVTVGTMNNSSVCGTVAPGAGSVAYMYSNYTGAVAATSQLQGATVNFSLTQTTCGGPYGNFFQIYIDWNQDGDWLDAGEQVYSQAASVTGNQTATGTFVVPIAATLGTTRMRVVVVEAGASTTNYAHTAYTWGESEDYCFTVTAPVGCTGTPNAGTAAISSTNGCPSVNFNLSATGLSSAGGISYQWQSGPTATGPWTAVPGGTTVPFTTSTASTTFYRLVTTCSNSGLTNTSTVVSYTVAGGACACGPYPVTWATTTADEEITNVTVSTINNSSSCGTLAPGAGSVAYMYSNYTGAIAPASEAQGNVVNFSLTQSTCGGAYGNFFQIYVDWNQDGDWLDAGEQVYSQAASVTGNQTATGTFTVPFTATVGTTRMRVVNIEDIASTTNFAHTTYLWGESEDYCFTVTPGTGCTGTPNAGSAAISSASGCSGVSFNLSATGLTSGSGITYQWQSAPAAAGPWSNIVGATTPTYAATATATTYYRLVTTCSNSSLSNNSNVVSYTVIPCCTYSFLLTDSYGDGWNGATMEIRNGATVIATLGPTFTTGTLQTVNIPLGQSLTYTLFYTNAGVFPTEVGIQILDPNSTMIYNLAAGAGTVGTTLFTWTPTCAPPVPIPTAVTASSSPVCSGSPVTLTAVGASGTTYWFTTGCTTTGQIGTGATLSVSPSTTTTYYARNFDGVSWSNGCASTTVVVTPTPTVSAGTGSSICIGNTAQLNATGSVSTTTTYTYTGAVQSFTVPAGVTSITVDASGAQGGLGYNCPAAVPGLGGRTQATIAVVPGDVLNIYVGGQGGPGGTTVGGTAGYNGGGTGGGWAGGRSGGGGGGATDIRVNGTALANRVIIAAGGGGTGVNYATGNAGGNAGGLTGSNGLTGTYLGAGATQTAGGAPDGTLGQGGNAPAGQTGGGGGGGYYGGGSSAWEGGGGGSSYSAPTASAVTYTAGYRSGNGVVTLTYLGAPSVSWTPAATLSSSTILNPVATPTATTTYTVTATNGGCSSTSTVTVSVTPTPVSPTASSSTICYGANAQITASATADWYTTPTGGTLIGSAQTFTTPALTASTTYYIEGVANGCPAAPRNAVNVTVNPFPNTIPTANTAATGCNIYAPNAWTWFVNPTNDIVACVWSGANLNAVSANVDVLSSVPYQNGVPYIPRTVTISPGTQGSAQVRLYFTLQEFQMLQAVNSQLTSITQLGVTKFDNSNMTGNPLYLAPTAYLTPAQTGMTDVYAVEVLTPSFSTFAIHFNYGNTILPVEFTSLTAECASTGVKVEWSTASETQCSHYNVYRSTDGVDYTFVTTVAGAGTSSEPHNYSVYDMNAASGVNYYRVDQVDFNGTTKPAPLASVMCGTLIQKPELAPNPADESSVLIFPSDRETILTITILNSEGTRIKTQQTTLSEGRNAIPFNWADYPAGLYLIRTEHDGEQNEFKQIIME